MQDLGQPDQAGPLGMGLVGDVEGGIGPELGLYG